MSSEINTDQMIEIQLLKKENEKLQKRIISLMYSLISSNKALALEKLEQHNEFFNPSRRFKIDND